MFKEDHLSFRQRKYMKVKNIIGRALGGIGLVVLSPVYLAIIVAIKKEDGITAPVFFSQKRVGIYKEYFNLYKFRSMRTDTPHDKPTHLLENLDQYITKVGRFLRQSSLDELPQLWNIARGDMAVIGPRPALWNQDDLIAERDKYGANDVKPGLTGWAQINGRDELEIPVKARLDGEYVKKMGPLMDIRCFIGTVFSVLRSDGVVEGGTGVKKKLMVITNHSYMLWQFRRELIGKLMEDYDVIISTPFVGHEDDFAVMGCTMIETDVDRRGINPKTDMKLYLTYRRLLKEHHPDMVVTYSIKPNVYAGYACRQMRIPYCVNVQGLGTAFQKKGLREIVIRMYKTALKKAKTVYFENKGNAKVFLQEQIIRREQMCLLKGAGVNLKYYTYQKYPENDKVHFLYLGRIMKEKGMDELFYAAKELQRKEVPFVLDLVGFFEDEYKEKIDKLVDAKIAVFHGFQEDSRPYYAMADCVVLPSYHEGMSNVLLEAAATGRPVITSNIPGMYGNYFGREYIDRYESVVRAVRKEKIPIEILPGMEVFSTEDLPELIVNHKIMPLNQSRYILMEFAFDEDPEFADSILKRVEEVGARPVIAHAERYEFIQDYPQIAYRWFRKGYVIQANKGSFLGRFGGGPKRAADSLLRHNLISVIASDAHSPLQRTPYMLDAYEELSSEYSENHLDVLFQYNPARLCDNREILRLEPVPYSGR